MSKPVILTGLRANNDLHIGNYLGAMLPMIDMAKEHAGEYQVNMFVPDLHSFTTPIDHSKLYEQTLDNIKMYVAAGLLLDDEDIHVYRQSFIPAHSELTWILSCFTYFGEMRRMTQFKDKSAASDIEIGSDGTDSVSVGLFSYPVLMAADILLYDAKYVPVGDDQAQHLEFTRDIAERMNKKFGELFQSPLPVKQQHEFFGKDQGLRIRDLVNPENKMSKSNETGKGVVFLMDEPETARKKVMSATTDSLEEVRYDYDKQPGISNLLDIYKFLGGEPEEFIGQTQYGPLKQAVADKVTDFIEGFQEQLAKVDDQALMKKLESSEAAMNQIADKKLYEVQLAVGLRAKNRS